MRMHTAHVVTTISYILSIYSAGVIAAFILNGFSVDFPTRWANSAIVATLFSGALAVAGRITSPPDMRALCVGAIVTAFLILIALILLPAM